MYARLGLALLAGLLLAACGGEYPQSSIAPRTDFAEVIQDLYAMILWITLAILALVWILLGYVLVRFRERPDTPHPKQIHGHLGLEIGWTIGPALIVVAIAVPTVQAVFATQQRDPGEGSMVVEVVGHQFWWEFRYPDEGVTTANELHLPVGRRVSLRLESADVIHSFWVPMLGGKRDVNPVVRRPEGEEERYNWLHFTINEPGVYMGQCAEFCGPSHSLMGVRVVAESEEAFQGWLADWSGQSAEAAAAPDEQAAAEPPDEQAAAALPDELDPALVEEGREVFMRSTCIACHAIEGTSAQSVIAPNLTLLGRRGTIAAGWLENTPENLARWIASPRSVKPGVAMPGMAEPGGNWPATGLTEEQVEAIAHYLSSLR